MKKQRQNVSAFDDPQSGGNQCVTDERRIWTIAAHMTGEHTFLNRIAASGGPRKEPALSRNLVTVCSERETLFLGRGG